MKKNKTLTINTVFYMSTFRFLCRLAPLLLILCFGAPLHARDATALRSLENRLLPWFLHHRQSGDVQLSKKAGPLPPSTGDLMAIASNWNALSGGFKKLYLESTEIPEGLLMHRSPGFGIEIHYAVEGRHAVDPRDSLGTDGNDWRKFVNEPNRVPDYVDEAARALDSAWCMEVAHFGFPAPYPYTSASQPSGDYKVVIELMESGYYGLTYPVGPLDSGDVGYKSLITLRNNWDGWNINDIIDYESHPEKGIRITCTHELFHAIQYRMTRKVVNDIYLDDFPLSWIEGTAGMMEELAYPEVNDYLQYCKSYFDNPTRFVAFSRSSTSEIYANTLLCLYLYSATASGSGGIKFFRSVFAAAMSDTLPFTAALKNASTNAGRTWVDLLNSFHAASFHTGSRSSDGPFLDDATLLPEWNYIQGDGSRSGAMTRTVKPWGFQCISFVNDDPVDSILALSAIIGSRDHEACSICAVLRDTSTNSSDSIIYFIPTAPDSAAVYVADWHRWNEAIILVSNGLDKNDLIVTLQFDISTPPINRPKTEMPLIRHRPDHRRHFLLNGKMLSETALRSACGAASPSFHFSRLGAAGLYINEYRGTVSGALSVR